MCTAARSSQPIRAYHPALDILLAFLFETYHPGMFVYLQEGVMHSGDDSWGWSVLRTK